MFFKSHVSLINLLYNRPCSVPRTTYLSPVFKLLIESWEAHLWPRLSKVSWEPCLLPPPDDVVSVLRRSCDKRRCRWLGENTSSLEDISIPKGEGLTDSGATLNSTSEYRQEKTVK